MFFEDFPIGHSYVTSSFSLSEEEIIGFARAHDPQPFHTDPEAARQSPYGGIIASGFQTMIEAFKRTLAEGGWAEASMGSPGMEEVRWVRPVRPGEVLHVVAEVIDARPSQSKPDRGFTKVRYDVLTEDGALAMSYTSTHIFRRRPVEA